MEKKDVRYMADAQLRGTINYIMEEGMGAPIAFSAVPTLADMKSNTWGFYGNDIYIMTNSGTGIKLTGASFT